ncbi:cell division protein FtsQ/DivIB [Curvibacter gracilis]|uniref:cell division protein FtsQ/DivIB n=1 Tax=Curvibacter gracilis TaxID=230310 RepID=UPI00048021F7|nr:cell division protein FtsQ/DivIB [Curvibacter gracilis]
MSDPLAVPLDVKLMNLTASVLFMGCVALVVASGGWWVLRHPAFSIGSLSVQGEFTHNNAVTLRANVAHKLMGNFFTVDLRQVREAFEGVPWVRHAAVRRQFPNQLQITLEEHVPVALWGPESGSGMLNSFGEVFEANVDDVDQDDLPRLYGPAGQSVEVLDMYGRLRPILQQVELDLAELELTPRGGWRATLDSGATIELGSGSVNEVLARTRRFVATLTQVTSRYGRRPGSLESADLRHTEGYALRLRGVTTVSADLPKMPKK